MTMEKILPCTRQELQDRLRQRLGLSNREAGLMLEAFLETIVCQLEKGGVVTLSGLGRFDTRLTTPRPGRNPATGQEVIIPAHIRPVFTFSRSLRTIATGKD